MWLKLGAKAAGDEVPHQRSITERTKVRNGSGPDCPAWTGAPLLDRRVGLTPAAECSIPSWMSATEMPAFNALFSFRGRLRRLHWWLLGFLVGGAGNLLALVCTILLFDGQVQIRFATFDQPVGFAIRLAIDSVVAWAILGITVRRAHDINWPAWPFVGVVLATLAFDYAPRAWVWQALDTGWLLLGLFLSLAAFAILGFVDGTPGANRHGPPPKQISRTAAFLAPGGLE